MIADNPHHSRRWTVLAILAIAQLMVVLDATIVNIALPSAQRALHFANTERQWVVTAYALAFGSLLLLGGRGCGPVRPQVDRLSPAWPGSPPRRPSAGPHSRSGCSPPLARFRARSGRCSRRPRCRLTDHDVHRPGRAQ